MNHLPHLQIVDDPPRTPLKAPSRIAGLAADLARTPCGRYWAVAQTHPQAERWATASLIRRGYRAYLPMVTVSRRDRVLPTLVHRTERPLFTSYLFVSLDAAEQWSPIRYIEGIRDLLMSGSHPHRLATGVFEAIQAGGAVRRTPAPETSLPPGAACTVSGGPFGGQEAVVIAVTGSSARIALPILGGIHELVLPVERLTARIA